MSRGNFLGHVVIGINAVFLFTRFNVLNFIFLSFFFNYTMKNWVEMLENVSNLNLKLHDLSIYFFFIERQINGCQIYYIMCFFFISIEHSNDIYKKSLLKQYCQRNNNSICICAKNFFNSCSIKLDFSVLFIRNLYFN